MSYKQQSPLPIVEGGTGTQLFEMAVGKQGFGVILCGVVSTSPLEVIQDPGTVGQVLTSNGIGNHPTFETISFSGAVTELTGDTGGAVLPSAGNINIIANVASLHAGSSVSFSGAGSTLTFNVTDGGNNTIIGLDAGRIGMSGTDNTILGDSAGALLTTGTGSVMVGRLAGSKLTTGGINTLLGTLTGFNYTGNEHSNICIGYSTEGTTGENNTLRIGDGTGSGVGQLSQTFISGIAGVNVGSVATVVTEAGDKLGTAVLTAGTGITITPGANTITIAANSSGVVETITGDDGDPISPISGNIFIQAGVSPTRNCGSTVQFVHNGGSQLLLDVTDINDNTILGANSGSVPQLGANNTIVGQGCGPLLTGSNNTIIGTLSGESLTTGADNVFVGRDSGTLLTTGVANVLIGSLAGTNYLSSESDNILISSLGIVAESNVLRIGSATGTGTQELAKAFICGIDGVNVGSVATIVTELGDQLGTAVLTAGTNITITPGANTITIDATGGGGGASSFPTDSGTATQSGGTLNIIANVATLNAGSTVEFSGSGDTVQLNVTDGIGNTIIGINSGNAGITGHNNTVLGNNSATTAFSGGGNVVVGSSAATSLNAGANNVMLGNGTGASITNASGNTFIGTGAGASATGANNNICLGSAAGSSFSGSTGSIMIGANAGGSFSGNGNILIGINVATSLSGNAANNVIIGPSAAVSLGNASHNVMVGLNAANSLATGIENVIIGTNAGTGYGTNESSNIVINDNGNAAAGQSHVLTIGAGTGTGTQQLNQAFIHGIRGITPASADGIPVFIGSTGQLGTVGSGGSALVSTLTGDTGGAISPSSGNINIKTGNASQNAGSSVLFAGSGSTLTFDVTDGNINTIVGQSSGNGTLSGATNTIFGAACGGGLTSGSANTMAGYNCAQTLTTGTNNTLLGIGAAGNYTSSESYNVLIGSNVLGTNAESNVLRIGAGTGTGANQLNAAFISGISGITVTGAAVLVSAGNQLGVAVSTRKSKHDIEDMNDQSSSILNLRPVTFVYNNDETEAKQYGLIAEEVDEVFPDIVARDQNGEIQTVMYHVLPVLLLNEIKKLNARIAILEARL